jgi:hypothetical protein
VPRQARLQDLQEKSSDPWLQRLIVAVDSRRARRALQSEFPGEVFDSSTTDIREIVIHYHRQPTANACLSCIYMPDEDEMTREQHIAEHLGVDVDEVHTERISEASAITIANRFPKLSADTLVGMAYDTLFKQLCAESALLTPTGRTVIAPFAFVSVLAGAFLALEVARRLHSEEGQRDEFNYWRVSAWSPPLSRRKILRPKETECKFCGDQIFSSVNRQLWSHSINKDA